ncbi:hypothetical protein JCM33374_g1837 [Metschnikowia sp. JCM 33374]|nr:hypothetical protein JCM33374_g1837 [Metschnikowia sp. JCM 33374]
MFYKKPLLLSNDFASKSMPLCHLRQLIDMGIHITPSEVNINVFDFTDFEGSFSLWECFSASLFQFMSRLDSRFNIELVLWENVPLDTNLLRAWLDPLIKHGIEVTNCKIRYSSSLGFVPSRNTEPFNDYKIIEDTGAMSVENLHLNFFGPSEICRQLSPQKPCINLDSIQYLDLSFNQLTDMDLRSIQFPKALKELNLSNNSISVFDSESLPFETLSELKILDLSNNNIMRLDICSPRDQICSSVQVLNLSGNFLSTYSPLFGGPLFSGLQEIDLSHNLISQLSGFTESLKRVNLTGNYITKQPEPSALCFSKNLEVLGIDRFLVDALYETENTQPSCKA